MIMGRRKNTPTIDQIDAVRSAVRRSGFFSGALTAGIAAAFFMAATPAAHGADVSVPAIPAAVQTAIAAPVLYPL